MLKNLFNKFRDSFFAVFPITAIVLLLSLTLVEIDKQTIIAFVISSFMIIIGMSLFTLGVDLSMLPMGESIGASLSESKKPYLMLIVLFILGFLITISEPDLQVLAEQLYSIPTPLLMSMIAGGVGVFLILYYLKVFFNIKLSYILIIGYAAIFILAIFASDNFMPLAFDSGGVMTGPMTVPFLMALGIGISTVKRSSKDNDSFGIISLCTIGPILMVMLLGLIYTPQNFSTGVQDAPNSNILMQFVYQAPKYFKDVAIAFAPLIVVFAIFQIFVLKFPKTKVIKLSVGLIYTYIGLVLFLWPVNVGFFPVGKLLGAKLAALPYNWILIPLGFIIGLVVILAEPTVHILIKQVEELTGGAVSKKIMLICLTLGVAVSVMLSIIRIMAEISIWYFLLPGYFIALLLTFFVPSIFTSIAFDSGSISSGPMTVTFIMPFAIGICAVLGGNIMQYAFGIVAMVSMAPLLTIQAFGLVYKIKLKKKTKKKEIPEAQQAQPSGIEETEPLDLINE